MLLVLGCRSTPTSARAVGYEVDAAKPDVALADTLDARDLDLDDGAPLTGIDGVYTFTEHCHGAQSHVLSIHGKTANLKTGGALQSLQLRAAAGHIDATPAAGGPVVFRGIVRRGMLTLQPIGAAFGSFHPTCTEPGSVVFLERRTETAQVWTARTFRGVSLKYPSKLLNAREVKDHLELVSPHVFGNGMNGDRFDFAIRITVHEKPILPVLEKALDPGTVKARFPAGTEASFLPDEGFFTRATVAGLPGYLVNIGIEGTYTRTNTIKLTPTKTLAVAVDYASDFANIAITMSAEEQLAIADLVMLSMEL